MKRYLLAITLALLSLCQVCTARQQAQTPLAVPKFEAVYDTAASALAKMELPDFSSFDKNEVTQAFREIFSGFEMRPGWVDKFKTKIASYSNGKVRLEIGDRKDFHFIVKGPASYFLLIRDGLSRRVIIGPYSDPISFDDD